MILKTFKKQEAQIWEKIRTDFFCKLEKVVMKLIKPQLKKYVLKNESVIKNKLRTIKLLNGQKNSLNLKFTGSFKIKQVLLC